MKVRSHNQENEFMPGMMNQKKLAILKRGGVRPVFRSSPAIRSSCGLKSALRGKVVWTISLFVGLLLAQPGSVFAATNDLKTILQKGLFEEEANHNFGAAIELYQTLITNFDQERNLAATAVFRLGECYRKQGKTNEAVAQYQRVVREFADQEQLAAPSRQNLASLGVQEPGVRSTLNPRFSGATDAAGEAAALKAELDSLKAMPASDLRIAIAQDYSNPVLHSLMQKLAETQQNLAALNKEFGPNHPKVVEETARLKTVTAQIDDQVRIALKRLESKQKAAEAKSETMAGFYASPSAEPEGEQSSSRVPSTTAEAEEVRRIQGMIKDSPDLINAKRENGATPLFEAANAGRLVVARFLLEHGANVEVQDRRGWTPLHAAAARGHKAMAELLLDYKAPVNATEYLAGQTPLHLAVEKGYRSVAELLLDRGANVNAKDKEGRTPLSIAANFRFPALAELLVAKGADVNAGGQSSPLALAVANGDEAMAKLLLDDKANPNALSTSGMTALDIAAGNGNLKLAELLLSRGADVNAETQAPDARGWTALHYAVMANQPEMVSWLIKNKADPEAKIQSGFSVLHFFKSRGSWGEQVAAGYTPLLVAVTKGFPEVVTALLAGKADPNQKSDEGDAPLLNCIVYDQAPAQVPILKALLDAGANSEVRTEAQMTPLLLAAQKRDKPALDLLLEHKASVKARDEFGNTALHLLVGSTSLTQPLRPVAYPVPGVPIPGSPSSGRGNAEILSSMAKALLDAGIDVNAQNKQGQTALEMVLSTIRTVGPGLVSSPPGASELAQTLRAAGAIEDLPRFDVIQVSRPSANYRTDVLLKGTNDFNRFTLFELLAVHYGFVSASPVVDPLKYHAASRTLYGSLQFPDLSHVVIRRAQKGKTQRTAIEVDLHPALSTAAGIIDRPLQWGDVVEIPEMDHPIKAIWQGLPKDVMSAMDKALRRSVSLTIKGQSTNLVLAPEFFKERDTLMGPTVFNATPPDFALRPALYNSGLLRASSDLSRIRVLRHDNNGQNYEMVLDCSDSSAPGASLWLRDGDQIEVPEKPQVRN